MPYRALLLAVLCLLLSACLRTSKPLTMDTRCTHTLDRARQLFAANTKSADSVSITLAEQLIGAARIARQHHKFINCLERSSRAISLLDPSATSDAGLAKQ